MREAGEGPCRFFHEAIFTASFIAHNDREGISLLVVINERFVVVPFTQEDGKLSVIEYGVELNSFTHKKLSLNSFKKENTLLFYFSAKCSHWLNQSGPLGVDLALLAIFRFRSESHASIHI